MKHIVVIASLAITAAASAQTINQGTLVGDNLANQNVIRNRNNNNNSNSNTNSNQSFNFNSNTSRSNSESNARSAANANSTISVEANTQSVVPDVTVVTDFVEWKRLQADRKNWNRTKKGSTVSPYDSRSAVASVSYSVPADPNKARYDAFLVSQGHNPQTIGHSTLHNGKIIVKSAFEVYGK
jgi:hypothetical protein